jgi:hypothetical protein
VPKARSFSGGFLNIPVSALKSPTSPTVIISFLLGSRMSPRVEEQILFDTPRTRRDHRTLEIVSVRASVFLKAGRPQAGLSGYPQSDLLNRWRFNFVYLNLPLSGLRLDIEWTIRRGMLLFLTSDVLRPLFLAPIQPVNPYSPIQQLSPR